MNMPVRTTDTAVRLPATAAKVLTISPKRSPLASRVVSGAGDLAALVVPPVIVIALAN